MSATPTLDQLLSGYLATALNSIATANGLQVTTKGKQAMQSHLAAILPRPERVLQALDRLDPAARTLLDRLHLAGGRASWDTLMLWCHLQLLPVIAPKLPARAYGDIATPLGDPKSTSPELHHVLARLECAGLALGQGNRNRSFSQGAVEFGRAQAWVIPAEIAAGLPGPAAFRLPPAETPAVAVAADPSACQRQLFLLWSWIWRTEPHLLKNTGRLAKRELKLLAAALPQLVRDDRTEEEQPWLDWARRLLMQMGLLRDGEVSRGVLSAAEPFWAAPLADRLRLCLETYLDLQAPVELQAADLHPFRGALSSWRAARRLIWAQLEAFTAAGAPGDWIAVASLEMALALRNRDFLVPPAPPVSGYYGSWQTHRYASGVYFSSAPSGADSDVSGWRKVELPFIRRVLIQLQRLGVADLGLREPAAPGSVLEAPLESAVSHLRLNAWGRHLLLGEPRPSDAASEARIVLQPNFQILVMGPLPEGKLFSLERFADRSSADRAITYTLSRDSVYRGQRGGISVAAMTETLRELTGAEIPQNVAHSLLDWQRQHERVVLHRRVTVLQAATPALAQSAALAAGGAVLHAVGEGFLLTRDRAAMQRSIQQQGLMVETQPPRSPEAGRPTVVLHPDGRVQPRDKCVDPWTLGRLQTLADGDMATGWRLTDAAVRRCQARRGLDAAAQIALWTRLAQTVPEPMVRLIKRHTGIASPARLLRGCYLELPDDAALQALAELPELADAYGAVALRGPLLWVDEARLAEIEAALDGLGLGVQAGATAGDRPEVTAGDAGAPVASPVAAPKRRGRPPKTPQS